MKDSHLGYVERLRRRFRKDAPYDFDFAMSEKRAKIGLNQIVIDIAKQLMPHAAMRIGVTEKDELERRLTRVSMIEVPSVNGFTRSLDGWKTFEIGISLGLMMFFHQTVKVFASTVGVVGEDGRPVEDPKIPFENTVSVAKRLMKAFWEGELLSESGFQLMQLSDSQTYFSAHLLREAERFVVAHEFGHIVIKLCPGNVNELDVGIRAVKHTLKGIPGFSEAKKNQLARQWGEEIGADLIGLQLSVMLQDSDYGRILAYSATEWVLILQKMLETFYRKNYQKELPFDTHPPSQLRLRILRLVVSQSNPPQALELGKACEQLADVLLSKA